MANIDDLLKQAEAGQTPPPADSETKKDDSTEIKIPAGLLTTLQDQIKSLNTRLEAAEKRGNGQTVPDEVEEEKVHTAYLRQYNDELVVGYNKVKNTWLKYDQIRREDRLMMEIIVLNKEGKEVKNEVDYMKFMEESVRIDVPLLRVVKKEVVNKGKWISVREVVDYKTITTNNKVQQKVVSSEDSAVIRMPDGTEKTLDIRFINM